MGKMVASIVCLLSKLQPNQTFYGGTIGFQARVPPILALFIINSTTEGLTFSGKKKFIIQKLHFERSTFT